MSETAPVTGLLGLCPDGLDVDACDPAEWMRPGLTVVETASALLVVDPADHSLVIYPRDPKRARNGRNRVPRSLAPGKTNPPLPGEAFTWHDADCPASDPWGESVLRGAGTVLAVRKIGLLA